MLYLLLGSLILLDIVIYIVLDRDILSPAFVVSLVFTVSTLCCIVNSRYWLTKINYKTFFVIIGGCIVFALVAILVRKVAGARFGEALSAEPMELEQIRIAVWLIILIIALNAVLAFLQVRFVKSVCVRSSRVLHGWSDMMTYYRNVVSYDTSGFHISMPSYIILLYKISTIFAYCFLYVCIHNLLANDGKPLLKRVRLLDTLPVLAAVGFNLLCATRGIIIQLFLGGVTCFHLLYHKKYGWNRRYGAKIILKLGILVLVVLGVFVALRDVVGRMYSDAAKDPIYYICCYAGGSIHLFNSFLVKGEPPRAEIWGGQTFYSIVRFLGQRLNKPEWVFLSHFEYRRANGYNVGNIYTAFRKYISDFGYAGAVWCTALVSLIYNTLYYRIRCRKKRTASFDVSILFFSYISYGYYYMSIQEQPLSTILCMTTLVMPVIFLIVTYFMRGFKGGRFILKEEKKL